MVIFNWGAYSKPGERATERQKGSCYLTGIFACKITHAQSYLVPHVLAYADVL